MLTRRVREAESAGGKALTSAVLAGVATIIRARLDSKSTPMWAFIPKNPRSPVFVWRVSGARVPVLLLVEHGAWMIVASTSVPIGALAELSYKRTLSHTVRGAENKLRVRSITLHVIACQILQLPAVSIRQ